MGDYDRTACLCHQHIETQPDDRCAYWHLGVLQVLQEREEEAQFTWLTVLAEASEEEQETWVNELLNILEFAVEEQEQLGNLPLAWTLRHHIRNIAPDHIDNLLQTVQLSLQLDQFQPQDIHDMALTDLIAAKPDQASVNLLLQTIQQLPSPSLGHPDIIKFVETCLPCAKHNPAPWIETFLGMLSQLTSLRAYTVACIYIEFACQLDEDNPALMQCLARQYLNSRQNFDKAIELAESSYSISQCLSTKLFGCHLLMDGYLSKGSLWNNAAALLPQLTDLLKEWATTTPVSQYTEDSNDTLCSAMFVLPYFRDVPEENRRLQNAVGRAYQGRLHDAITRSDVEYQTYLSEKLVCARNRIFKKDKLRIGYISKSMWRHSVGWLSRWLFHHHDRERFEIYAYFNHQLNIDAFSRTWFVNNSHKARTFEGSILGIAKEIQKHDIDILVDLDSLTNAENYGVLALKPAPIQVSWLGLDAPGLPAVDYFIVDPYVVPEGAQNYYSETLWRLPQTYLAVDGFEVWMPTVSRDDLGIPNDATVYLTSQMAFKLHPETLRLQFQILQEVPDSYLVVKGAGDQQGIQALFYHLADEAGVRGDRLRFLERIRFEENHRANLAIADVVLDTFPYNGATTTMETLWMGIPLVTKVGQQFAARNSYTMMVNAGISEGIAWNDEEYVEWGVRLGNDADLREHISWKLRQSRRTAPLWDAKQFTRQMESAYEHMWAIYCGREHS